LHKSMSKTLNIKKKIQETPKITPQRLKTWDKSVEEIETDARIIYDSLASKIKDRDENLPEEKECAREWKMDANGNIIDFNLTDCRRDIIYRLKNNVLYTLEECKEIIREIVSIQQKDAEMDLKNLMFLSSFRNDVLFPQPVAMNYLDKDGIEGFSDTEEVKRLLKQDILEEKEDDELRSPYQRLKALENINFIPILKPKDKIQRLLRHIHRSIVVLIDNSLRQRKERLLLAATILSELEGKKLV
jgi:hypothetical protein